MRLLKVYRECAGNPCLYFFEFAEGASVWMHSRYLVLRQATSHSYTDQVEITTITTREHFTRMRHSRVPFLFFSFSLLFKEAPLDWTSTNMLAMRSDSCHQNIWASRFLIPSPMIMELDLLSMRFYFGQPTAIPGLPCPWSKWRGTTRCKPAFTTSSTAPSRLTCKTSRGQERGAPSGPWMAWQLN